MARPTKMTPVVRAKLLGMLRAGASVGAAARAAGVSRSAVYDRIRREPAFAGHVERARADGEARNVTMIVQAAPWDWRAAAWRLEHEYPERWGLRPRCERATHRGYVSPGSGAGSRPRR